MDKRLIFAILLLLLVQACSEDAQDDDVEVIDTNSSSLFCKNISAGQDVGEINMTINNETINDSELNKTDEAIPDNETVDEDDEGIVETEVQEKLIMFHNGRGPMCISQLDFLDEVDVCDELVVEEYLTTEPSTYTLLSELRAEYKTSTGVSSSFGYLPITFINGHAYSGFDSTVEENLLKDIEVVCG